MIVNDIDSASDVSSEEMCEETAREIRDQEITKSHQNANEQNLSSHGNNSITMRNIKLIPLQLKIKISPSRVKILSIEVKYQKQTNLLESSEESPRSPMTI